VLHLLVVAFERRLTFTVGFSVVRGKDNCIVWNGVHHKTNTSGGATHYGYPDVSYFNRLKQELALKSVKLDENPKIVA
jgi:deltex-like protein